MKKLFIVAPLALCASVAMADELQAKVEDMMLKSFQANGIATLERQKQDEVQKACSSPTFPDADTMKRLEAAEMATIGTLLGPKDLVLTDSVVAIIKRMPRWIPGKHKGQAVDVYYTMPLHISPARR